MIRLGSACPSCAAPESMRRMFRYTVKSRLVKLLLPVEPLRCDHCSHEAWAWNTGWFTGRPGEVPAGLLLLICVAMLIIAYIIDH